MFTSELVIVEASAGNPDAASRRLAVLQGIAEIPIDHEVKLLAEYLIAQGGVPSTAKADALHIAVATVHRIDYLLTWNFKHIDNAITKPIIRSICTNAGYICPEICTPMEIFPRSDNDV